MKKPYKFDQKLIESDETKEFVVKFNEDSTHEDVVYQFVTGLVRNGFASELEVIEETSTLLQVEIENFRKAGH